MTSTYNSTSAVRTLTAIAFAIIFSATCVMGAIAPAAMQSVHNGAVAEVPVA